MQEKLSCVGGFRDWVVVKLLGLNKKFLKTQNILLELIEMI